MTRNRQRTTVRRALLEGLESRVLMTAAAVESITGAGNNLLHPSWGSAGMDLLRQSPVAYADGISKPAGAARPSARAISNALSAQSEDLENNRHLSDFVYLFGQFLDHDLDLTTTGSDAFNVAVPTGDPWFDPNGTGTQTIGLTRSTYDAASGKSRRNPRIQVNAITSFIDGSQIYGSDAVRAAALRTFAGGRMKTSAGNMLPFNTDGLANANDAHIVADSQLYLAGDIRANENIELTAIQTLFVREHNRLADQFAAQHPAWTDEQVFQAARRVVIAELQAITFNEFLPALLGPMTPGPYQGYKPNVNPSISVEFSTAAFRFGHSMLDGDVARMNNNGTTIPERDVHLQNAFFNPTLLDPTLPNHEGDIDPLLKGAATGNAQEIDLKLVDDVRNFLFGPPGSGGFDLASLNIQRGRDHGLADYNTLRTAYGLPRVTSFAQITSDVTVQAQLKSVYGSVDRIDAWVGGLAEDHVKGASVGALFGRIIANQFARLRDGDRFWYENTFSGTELLALRNTHLSDILRRNTSLTNLQGNVFFYFDAGTSPAMPPPPPPLASTVPQPTAAPAGNTPLGPMPIPSPVQIANRPAAPQPPLTQEAPSTPTMPSQQPQQDDLLQGIRGTLS